MNSDDSSKFDIGTDSVVKRQQSFSVARYVLVNAEPSVQFLVLIDFVN